jgi:DNA-binding response OmpR family regulator
MADPKKPAKKSEALPSTVLVVDDEEVVRDVLSRALTKRSIPFELAEDGKSAVEKLKSSRFGCVVTDKNLPDISGVDVLREAKKLQPFCARIMITGYTTPESLLEVLRMGASDYIEKPFNDMQLVLQRIQSAIEHQRTEFERNTLVDVLKGMQAQLQKQSQEMFEKGTELEMLQSVLEFRVDEATAELKSKLQTAEKQSRSDREVARNVLQRLDELLMIVAKEMQTATEADDGSVSVLRDLETRLKDATQMLRDELGAQ